MLVLQPHLQRLQFVLQRLVFEVHLVQGDVAEPEISPAGDQCHGTALHLGERAEGHHLQYWQAGSGVDLGGDQDHV